MNDSPAGDVARAYLGSFSSGDPHAIAAHVAPDFVNDHASALGSSCVGREEYLRRLPQFLASFPGLRYEVGSVIVGKSGDGAVAVEYRMVATIDGRPIDIRGVMVMNVRDGLITRRTDYWDALTYLRQTGRAP